MILVTGGTGFIGRSLVGALAGGEAPVRILSRAPSPTPPGPVRAEIVIGDVLDAPSLDRALQGVTAVVHLAAQHESTDPSTINQVNVLGTRNLVDAVRRHRVAAFLHLSSDAVYGMHESDRPKHETDTPAPISVYGRSKLEGEQTVDRSLRGTETRWVVLRPSAVFGPGKRSHCEFYRRLRARRLWLHAGPTTIVHPVFVDDVTRAIVAALAHTGVNEAIVNIAGDRSLSYREWLATIAGIVGGRLRQVQLPIAPTRAVAQSITALVRVAGSAPPYRLARLTWRSDNRTLDITRARELLGFVPSSLDRALTLTIESCRRDGRW